MSYLLTISPKGAFSCEWNKCIDRNAFCVVKFGCSIRAFFTALFCKYTVYSSEVNHSFLAKNSTHENSSFSRECRKKLIKIKLFLNNKNACLGKGVGKATLARDLVKNAERLIGDRDFQGVDDYLSKQCIKLLNAEECCQLFIKVFSMPIDEKSYVRCAGRCTLLYRLLSTGHCDELVKRLVCKNNFPRSFFLKYSCWYGVAHMIKIGVVYPHEEDSYKKTFLILAAEKGCVDGMQMLLEAGVNLNACDKNGMTALHHAAFKGHLESVRFLLGIEGGILTDAKNREGMTALYLSAQMNKPECSKELVLKGAGVHVADASGRTPLSIACSGGNTSVVETLLSLDKSMLNEADGDGCTPLHHAVGKSIDCTIALLKEGGISMNAKDKDGNTPLHYAVYRYSPLSIQTLLKAGASADEKNKRNKTPLDIARKIHKGQYIHLFNAWQRKQVSQASGNSLSSC